MIANRVKPTVAQAISSDERLDKLVSAACQTLDDLIQLPGPEIHADWSLAKNANGLPEIVLELSDDTASTRAVFSPKELGNPRETRSRLIWILGGLMQVRTHKLLEKMLEPDK